MNDAAEQKPQTSPQRLHTCGNPQIQGYTNEPSLIKGLFIVRFDGRMRRQDFWLSQLLLLPLNCLLGCGSILGTFTASLFDCGGLLSALLILLWILCAYFSFVNLGMHVRRLHDIGISGQKYLLGIIIYFLVSFLWSELFLAFWSELASVVWHDPNEIIVPIVLGSVGGAIPSVLGIVILIVLFCRDSQYETNQWGPNPKGQGNTQKIGGAEKYRLAAEREAARKYRLAAEQGDAHAQYNLGQCYYKGEGVDKNYTEATTWYRLAAEQGHAKAQYKLGKCYAKGEGVDKDIAEAVRWFQKAVADEWATDAMVELGRCYLVGLGVEKDVVRAGKWFRRAAEHWIGNPEAMLELGRCYLNGIGVEKDGKQAVDWFRKAVEYWHWTGSPEAMFELGKCYLNGIGIKKDEKQAKQWLRKATDAGNILAKALLQQLEQK